MEINCILTIVAELTVHICKCLISELIININEKTAKWKDKHIENENIFQYLIIKNNIIYF